MPTDAIESKSNFHEVACQSCGASLLVDSHTLSTICPYCASSSIIERPPSQDLPRPAFAIGFVLDHQRATDLVLQWIRKSHVLARSDFKRAAPQLIKGIYLPAYLYGAVADSDYSASIGENYTEVETYTTTDANGRIVTRTRTVTKTEWRPLAGRHCCYVVDVVVTASRGVSNMALEAIEPFDLRSLRRFSPSLITGWLAELPSLSQDECFQMARGETIRNVGVMLKSFMPGDSHQNLRYDTRLSREVIDLVLFPVWSFAVRYDHSKAPIQILVNGQTGRVTGSVPISTAKISLLVASILLLIALFVLLVLLANR
jgi:predicted RNA-binding Zn-ribbon protein involved in translation (DUF1610 family)